MSLRAKVHSHLVSSGRSAVGRKTGTCHQAVTGRLQ